MNTKRTEGTGLHAAEAVAARVAQELGMELVQVTLQKEPQGKTLCIFIDTPVGVTLKECERFHRAVQPLLENVEYDFLEVSSPGVDRPIETRRDLEKNRDAHVELKLYAPLDGAKRYEGRLIDMDGESVTLALTDGSRKVFPRKAVALLKPVIDFELLEAQADPGETGRGVKE
ncbi:MAG: ribosome maturation factor RimP [Eubacteriales bacterium]|nr:ribosome maturation factor RimP [Eubacteriales bacterium]